jgi:hypothetical protein
MIPTFALIKIPGPRWLPPIPLFLFLLWPVVALFLGLAVLMKRSQPETAKKLWIGTRMFCDLRGLSIHTNTGNHSLRVRVV